MRISEERTTRLYDSIGGPITDLRIEQSGGRSIEEMDEALFELQQTIWKRVAETLNISNA